MVWKNINEELESINCKYFQELYKVDCINVEEMDMFSESVRNRMTWDANEKLKEPFKKRGH